MSSKMVREIDRLIINAEDILDVYLELCSTCPKNVSNLCEECRSERIEKIKTDLKFLKELRKNYATTT